MTKTNPKPPIFHVTWAIERHTHTEPGISNQSSLNMNQKHHLLKSLLFAYFFKSQMSILWKIASRTTNQPNPTNHHQPPTTPATNPTQPPTNQAPWPWTRWYYRRRRRSPRSGDLTSTGTGGSWWGFDLGAHRKPRVSPGCYLWLPKEISQI